MFQAKNRSLLDEAIEEGIAFGLRRGFKHSEADVPDSTLDYVAEQLSIEIWNAIDRRFVIVDPLEE